MVETKDVVIAVFGATTASSSLVLVFVGIVAATLWSPDRMANEFRRRFRTAGGFSSASFLSGLVCAGLSTWWLTLGQSHDVYLALLAAFLLQLVLLGVAAALVVFQTIFGP